jgi:hypothetical protein
MFLFEHFVFTASPRPCLGSPCKRVHCSVLECDWGIGMAVWGPYKFSLRVFERVGTREQGSFTSLVIWDDVPHIVQWLLTFSLYKQCILSFSSCRQHLHPLCESGSDPGTGDPEGVPIFTVCLSTLSLDMPCISLTEHSPSSSALTTPVVHSALGQRSTVSFCVPLHSCL